MATVRKLQRYLRLMFMCTCTCFMGWERLSLFPFRYVLFKMQNIVSMHIVSGATWTRMYDFTKKSTNITTLYLYNYIRCMFQFSIILYSDWLTANHMLFLKQLHHSIKLTCIIHENT